MHHGLIATYANPMIVCDAADFDGTNDFMDAASLSGLVDGKSGIVSFWARFDASGAQQVVFNTVGGPGSGLQIIRLSPFGAMKIAGTNSGGTPRLALPTSSSFSPGAAWINFLASWDLAAGVGNFYVNDVSDIGVTTLTNDTLDYAQPSGMRVGANPAGSEKFNGCLAELYFAANQYLDFSLVANRRKFISASGKPVHLGVTGALPTGVAPTFYLHLDDAEAVANFATNRSGAGDFTITGALDTGSSSPSD